MPGDDAVAPEESSQFIGAYVYLFSVLLSFAISFWIRFYKIKHNKHICKKYDAWKMIDRTPKNMSLVAAVLMAAVFAIAGGMLNRISSGWDPLAFGFNEGLNHALFFAFPAGLMCATLTGSPILMMTTFVFTFTGTIGGWGCYESLAVLPAGSSLDCMGNNQTQGLFDWFLGKPDESWDGATVWSRDFIGLSLSGLMWTLPIGFPLSAYGYSSLVGYSGAAMGLAYSFGKVMPVPFPLCLMGGFPRGIEMGQFYMGAWLFFSFAVCVLGSKQALHPPVATASTANASDVSNNASIKVVPTMVALEDGLDTDDSDDDANSLRWSLKARALDADSNDSDGEPLVLATVVGEPVSDAEAARITAAFAESPEFGRCGRPLKSSIARQACWAAHLLARVALIFIGFMLACTLMTYSWVLLPEALGTADADADTTATDDDDEDWLSGMGNWYLWFVAYFLFFYAWRRRAQRGRLTCRRRQINTSTSQI